MPNNPTVMTWGRKTWPFPLTSPQLWVLPVSRAFTLARDAWQGIGHKWTVLACRRGDQPRVQHYCPPGHTCLLDTTTTGYQTPILPSSSHAQFWTCVKHPRNRLPPLTTADHVYPRPDQRLPSPRNRPRDLVACPRAPTQFHVH